MSEEDAGAEPENEQGNAPVETDANNMLETYKAENDRREKLLARQEELLRQQEALHVEKTLSGKTNAGVPQTKEETPEEYAARVMKNDDIEKEYS